MKKFKKLFLSLALVLVLVVPMLLTGCGVGEIGAAEIVCESAKNFYQTHLDYEHYEDTTYKFKTTAKETGKNEYTYKENATDAELVTKEKEVTSKYDYEAVVSFKNLDENDLGIYVYSKGSWVDSYYEVDEENQTLVPFEDEGYNQIEYIVAKKQVEEETIYYFTKVVTSKNGEDDEVVDKVYYEFEDRNAYVEFVENYIKRSKKLILGNSYFEFEGEMYLSLSEISVNNGVVTTKMGYVLPIVEYNEEYDEFGAYYGSYQVTSSCSKASLGEYSFEYVESGEFGRYETISTLNVNKSATGKYQIAYGDEGWVAIEAEDAIIDSEDFPISAGMM